MVNERRWLLAILALYFLLGIGYSLLMPIWEAPDEPAHYHLAWRLARKGEYATEELNYEANQPRAFYYIGSYIIRALDRFDTRFSDYVFPREYNLNLGVAERRFDWNDGNYRFLLGVYALRWMNLIFGAIALWINWRSFKIIAPEKPALRLSALALAALTPQYLHIMSSVNNDALGTLAGASLFYLAVRVQMSTRWSDTLIIPAAILLPLATKLTVLPVSAAALAATAWKWFISVRQKRWLVISAVLILLPALVLFFIAIPESFPSAASEITWRLFTFRANAWTWSYISFISNQLMATYWGQVGWLAVGLPEWVIYLLTVLGLTGALIHAIKLVKTRATQPYVKLSVITFMIAAVTLFAVIRNGLTTRGTQGRLLFPAIGALSLLMLSGWHEILPVKFQQYLPVIITVFFTALNFWLWVSGVLPVYYQPFLD